MMTIKRSSSLSRLRPWHFVFIFTTGYLVLMFVVNDFDSDVFVRTGDCYSHCSSDSPDEDCDFGYDGQFGYYIARDPGGAAPCIDVPAYRYQRILLPLLGRILAFGNEELIPYAFVIINLAALVISTALLEELLVKLNVSRWFAVVYSLFFGVFIGVIISTTEPLAYGLVILAIWLGQQNPPRLWLQAIVLALAMLTKETVGTFVAGYVMFYALKQRWFDAGRLALVVGIPFALWQLYLFDWLGDFGIGSGGDAATPFEIIPYNGVWRIWIDGNLLAFVILGTLIIPSVVIPSIWGIWVTVKDFWRERAEIPLYTSLYFWNVIIMPFIPFSTYREYLGIFRLVVGMVMMHILYTSMRYKGKRVHTYSTLWLVLIVLLAFLISAEQ